MATAAASASRPLAQSSSPAPGTRTAGTNAASRVANSHMTATASTSAAPLGTAPTVSSIVQSLDNAENQLMEGSSRGALQMFHIIYGQISTIAFPKTSFIPVRCLLGLAYSNPVGQRWTYGYQAQLALADVYLNKRIWTGDEISPRHSELRWHLKRLLPLIPKDAIYGNIATVTQERITECARFILLIDDFHEKVKEADATKFNAPATAQRLYTEALGQIADENGIEFKLARVPCLLKLTQTYNNANPLKATLRNRAQIALFELFGHRAYLYQTGRYTRVNAFTLLIGYLRLLWQLTSETDVTHIQAIQERIDICKSEIPDEARRIDLVAMAAGPTSGPRGPDPLPPPATPPQRVTPGSPHGSSILCRLLIGCVFIAIFAAATVGLYRRYVVKIN